MMMDFLRHKGYRRFFFFFFNDTATTEIYTLSLHDALPISVPKGVAVVVVPPRVQTAISPSVHRSEEHTSELQSQSNLVCRLLLEKKKIKPLHTLHVTVRDISVKNYSNTLHRPRTTHSRRQS